MQQPSERPANVSRLSAQTRLGAHSEMANGTGQFGISLQLQQHHAPMKSNYTLSSKTTLALLLGHYREGMTDFSANIERTLPQRKGKADLLDLSLKTLSISLEVLARVLQPFQHTFLTSLWLDRHVVGQTGIIWLNSGLS